MITKMFTISANAAFILVLAFEYFPNYKNAHKWKDLARNQINYLSGLTTGQSYIVDYGDIWPLQPQHKGSSCPLTESCGLSFKNRNSANLQVNFNQKATSFQCIFIRY